MIASGGYNFYGQTVGILMLDTKFPRIIGDVGNGFTYDFPVRFHRVNGATTQKVVLEKDPRQLEPFIEGAKELEAEGCSFISTSCGFLAMFQKELAGAVDIPVVTSGLLQVPFVSQILGPEKRIGILTANSVTLGGEEKHFNTGGAKIAVQGMQEFPKFYETFVLGKHTEYNVETVEAEMIAAAQKLIRENPDIGAIVCEGTNMAPFTPAINRVTGLPIFDITTAIRFVAMGVLRGMTNNFKGGWRE